MVMKEEEIMLNTDLMIRVWNLKEFHSLLKRYLHQVPYWKFMNRRLMKRLKRNNSRIQARLIMLVIILNFRKIQVQKIRKAGKIKKKVAKKI